MKVADNTVLDKDVDDVDDGGGDVTEFDGDDVC